MKNQINGAVSNRGSVAAAALTARTGGRQPCRESRPFDSRLYLTATSFGQSSICTRATSRHLPSSGLKLLALLVQVSLLGQVIEIEGIGIRLITEGCAMPDNNHVSALAQRLDELFLVSASDLLTLRLRRQRSSQRQRQASSHS